ncbi:hypothetical protein Kpol_1032p13 [Vanderwaltozyma polyspora DSM 70294]|uniref:G-protein coupled receptors family 1 profile domain-containing protein n=1 Tax=Vanderwaltozyma polyspora (strain ATCC 22028 / DSM 70294 / BCRC 21397 / CBS 2163 / NBRC 10782 / NRRL Y-8283 / UCD 57-17) TaxID=436907 RepID=A7TGW9_VANPO|nr:uncharacterized protein Kpol_1032p13 [Vanderwaltozyma polyspora DSM 70294]EDO18421.1 hypothetical protein Kpol_1032p13 [Vanderwaltozyma polyspora DSM 70294]
MPIDSNLMVSENPSLVKRKNITPVGGGTTSLNVVLGLPGLFSTFSEDDLLKLRILSIVFAFISLVTGMVGLFLLWNIDRRRKSFRHELLLYLIICDNIKTLISVIYPMILLIRRQARGIPALYNVLGFLTAFAIEGADFAIMVFALHFAILIFKPNYKWINKRTNNVEGGLYKYRYFIWLIALLTPIVLASLAFIDFNEIYFQIAYKYTNITEDNNYFGFGFQARKGGYKPLAVQCYLPPVPYWYKLALSWIPRYVLIVSIFGIYISIYVYVSRESSKIKREIAEFEHKNLTLLGETIKTEENPRSFKKSLISVFRHILGFLSLSLSIDDDKVSVDDSMNSRLLSKLSETKFQANQILKNPNNDPKDKDLYDNTNNTFNDINGSIENLDTSQLSTFTQGIISNNIPNNNNHLNDTISDNILNRNTTIDVLLFDGEADSNSNNNNNNNDNNNNIICSDINESTVRQVTKNNHRVTLNSEIYSMSFSGRSDSGEGTTDDSEAVKNIKYIFQKQTYSAMVKRRKQIQSNLRSIFIYPCSYIALWIFPIVIDITQYRYEISHGPVIWLAYISTIVTPLSSLVDTFVLSYRERPWQHSWYHIQKEELRSIYSVKGRIPEKDIREMCKSHNGRRGWYYRGEHERKESWSRKEERWKRWSWHTVQLFKRLFTFSFKFGKANSESRTSDLETERFSDVHKNGKTENITSLSRPSTLARKTANKIEVTNEELKDSYDDDYQHMSIFWKIIHSIPMLEGIDLDELNREIQSEYAKAHGGIVNLEAVTQALAPSSSGGISKSRTMNKVSDVNGIFYMSGHVDENTDNPRNQIVFTDIELINGQAVTNMDFSDVVESSNNTKVLKSKHIKKEDNEMDILSFLNEDYGGS